MPPGQEQLAQALGRAHSASVDGIVESSALTRGDVQRLVQAGYLTQIIRGWYQLHPPVEATEAGTTWTSAYWAFVRLYLGRRFAGACCLSAEASLHLHVGHAAPPRQLVVMTGSGGANTLSLPHDHTMLLYPDPQRLPKAETGSFGLPVMRLPEALARASLAWFREHQADAVIALGLVRDPAELARAILTNNRVRSAGHLAGALAAIGREDASRGLLAAVTGAGHAVTVHDPFDAPPQVGRIRSPYAARVRQLWADLRDGVCEVWPSPPGSPVDMPSALDSIDLSQDAYHSLSIEGYRVTPALIERIASGTPPGAEDRDALAAAGYVRAFNAVRASVLGAEGAPAIWQAVPSWRQALFQPLVEAGVLSAADILGYRRHPVYIRGARHVPPPHSGMLDAMEAFNEAFAAEPEPAVRAIVGHLVFTWVHPYEDGNGRLARFLMNSQLVTAGWPWTVIRVESRARYMEALDAASVDRDIRPFAAFVLETAELE